MSIMFLTSNMKITLKAVYSLEVKNKIRTYY